MSTAERYAAIVAELAAAAVDAAATDGQRIDSLTWLERIKSAAAAAQARLTDSFAVSQREKLIKAGAKSQDASRSITAQVALARKDSPHKGSRHVGLAATLVHEMPRVLDALERGETSEW
ncbi:MAG TPA: HNH endonuclease, partial [Nakamurella sp.]